MDIDWNRTVLLPIDMQRAFDGPPWPKRWNDRVDENGRALLCKWREAGRPIIHVRHDSVAEGSTLGGGTDGNRFRPGFEPQDGEPVVSKSVNSAFIGTDLDLRLRRLGARHVVAFGISTDMCVSTTVRTGSNMGWDMLLADDACDCFELPDGKGGRIPAEAVQAAHVATLGFEFCKVLSTADLLKA
ncbi:cysteine hydrolase [Sphingomonas sp. RB56-2]|uniref:Cysteine hydrolase n=1 Tax=Sphingomonas brevis TaxID=2908206 RepID=A0ABT0SAD2_9SPHN|nr:cysteine hydrolase family protein [Sphingomonas brevis]MCL6741089.1 cysteine hydrolase [Sphingomonas brevis]